MFLTLAYFRIVEPQSWILIISLHAQLTLASFRIVGAVFAEVTAHIASVVVDVGVEVARSGMIVAVALYVDAKNLSLPKELFLLYVVV